MTTNWTEVESKYYMFVVRRQPVVIVKGEGTKVWDVDGKEYLDFTSGWAVNNAGHANEAIAAAIAPSRQGPCSRPPTSSTPFRSFSWRRYS